jgi:DNA adenine methylase
LLSQILKYLAPPQGRLIEPFLGAGSVFFALAPEQAVLNDFCAPLVDTWNAVRSDPHKVYREATRLELTRDNYYLVRALRGGTLHERAGRFIYLNRGAFNGLYRVNLSGEFNVPWGAPKTQNIVDREALVAASRRLRLATKKVMQGDFERVVDLAGPADLVFLDPPYVTSHNDNGFIAYNEKIFSWSDQERLARAARRAAERGAVVAVTNANHPSIVQLYPDFRMELLERASTLAASSSKRGRTTEILLMANNG